MPVESSGGAFKDDLSKYREGRGFVCLQCGESELYLWQRLGEGQGNQMGEFASSHGCADDGDTFAGGCIGELHGAGLRRFEEPGRDSERREQIVEIGLVIGAVSGARHDDAGVAQIFDGDEATLRQRALPGDHGDEWFLTDGVKDKTGHWETADHEKSIDLAVGEVRDSLFGGKFAHFKLEVRVSGGEGANDCWKHNELAHRATADSQAERCVQAAEALLSSTDRIHDALRVAAEGETGLSQAHLLSITLEEFCSEGFLERLDLKRDGRLAHIKGTSRLAVVEQVRKR